MGAEIRKNEQFMQVFSKAKNSYIAPFFHFHPTHILNGLHCKCKKKIILKLYFNLWSGVKRVPKKIIIHTTHFYIAFEFSNYSLPTSMAFAI